MRRIALVAAGALAAYLALRWAARLFQSDEDRIRALIFEMREGFNRMRAGDVTGALADDFREETSGATKRDVHRGLVFLFFNRRDPETRDFLYRVIVPEESLSITVDSADPPSARAAVEARFEKRSGDSWTPVWTAAFEVELGEIDGEWKILRSRHKTLEGRMRF